MESKSFVDKVYDSYIREDYSYGDNNLNPKREIRKMTLRDTDEQLNRILAGIQRKVTEISLKYPEQTYEVEDAIGNFGGAGKVNELPSSVREAIHNAGGTGNTVVMIPSMDGDTSPLMGEIEITIAKILATIASSDNGTTEDANVGDELGTSGLDLYEIDCNGTLNLITGDENSNTDDEEESDEEAGDSDENEDEDEDEDEEDSDDGSDDDSDDNSDDDNTDSEDETSDAAMEDAVDQALAKMDEDIAANEASAIDCAIKDLGLMKAFLAILKVIQTIKKAMNPLMNILYDVAKIVTLAVGCWADPANIGEIIQRVVVKLIAILIMIIAMLVQMFWEMLGLDCLTEAAKSVIDQIKEALTGVSSTYNKCQRVAMSFGANVEKVADAFEEAQKSINDALKELSTDKIKEQFNLSEMAQDIYNNGIGGQSGLTASAMSGLQSTGAYEDILSTIENVKSMKETADKTIDTLMKSKGGKGANQTVRKISTQLHNVKVH